VHKLNLKEKTLKPCKSKFIYSTPVDNNNLFLAENSNLFYGEEERGLQLQVGVSSWLSPLHGIIASQVD
jgi:hypothetical protein